jgi:hypothetical protein
MPFTKEEILKNMMESIIAYRKFAEGDISDTTLNKFSTYFYTPDGRLPDFLQNLKEEVSKRENNAPDSLSNTEIGKLMEQIAYLCFKGLEGNSVIKSFQSAGPQYDLIVSGDNPIWIFLCEILYLKTGRDFLVEAKATKNKIGDPQFARLCSLLHFNLNTTSGLGIFFTLKGASGFPEPGAIRRQRSLSDSRLRQAIFMAACKKPIVVFDLNDILELDKPGSLVQILIDKIRDVEQLSGYSIGPKIDEPPYECELPKHLTALC